MILTKNYTYFLFVLLIGLCSCNKLAPLFSKQKIPTSYNTPTPARTTTKPPKAQPITAWNVETFYIIQDINPELGNRIIEELRLRVLMSPRAIRRLSREEIAEVSFVPDGFGFAIHPDEVANLSKLSRIQQVITDVSKKEVVALQLTSSVLNFQSVSGRADSFTEIFGEAPPDSFVEVDDGSGLLIEEYADQRGEWKAQITQNERLRDRNGFVYNKISKGKAVQYLEMDLLSKKRRRISVAELPVGSVFLGRKN